jgi:hypothetical protein
MLTLDMIRAIINICKIVYKQKQAFPAYAA